MPQIKTRRLVRKGDSRDHKGYPTPPVPAKPNILYSRGSFVDIDIDIECWTVD